MRAYDAVIYESVTRPLFKEPEKVGVSPGGSEALISFPIKVIAQTFTFVGEPSDTPPETVTVDKWYTPASEPFPYPEYPVNVGFTFIDLERAGDHETTFVSAWSGLYPDQIMVEKWPMLEGQVYLDPQQLTEESFPFVGWKAIYPDQHGVRKEPVQEGVFAYDYLAEPVSPPEPVLPAFDWHVQIDEPVWDSLYMVGNGTIESYFLAPQPLPVGVGALKRGGALASTGNDFKSSAPGFRSRSSW